MKWTLFLFRIALITNACFLLTVVLRWITIAMIPTTIMSTLVIAGWVLAPIVNVAMLILAKFYPKPTPVVLSKQYQLIYILFLLIELLFINKIL
ncbi:MAG: hypothetical protein FGM61_01470 [Sediminibacterium sp.]|nr:hypothetical protein [Sediminibacterium sp.]